MQIYVNSCGPDRRDAAHEYRWRDLSGSDQNLRACSLLNDTKIHGHSLADLVQTDSKMPSLVLARDSGLFYLLATRMPSLRRRGYQGETLFLNCLWVGPDVFNVGLLYRTLVADLLNSIPNANPAFEPEEAPLPPSILQTELDQVIEDDDEHGFRITAEQDLFHACLNRVEAFGIVNPIQSDAVGWRGRLGYNCRKLRAELAYELTHFSFPRSDGFLVVATGMKPKQALQDAYVWRGLSLLTESITWEPLAFDWKAQLRHEMQERYRAQTSVESISLA